MGLVMSFTDQAGVIHETAYVVVERVIADLNDAANPTLSVNVSIYHSKDKHDNGNDPVWGPQGYTFSLLGNKAGLSLLNNAVPAIYDLLQTLDRYQGVTRIEESV